jgi:hypothetical protein
MFSLLTLTIINLGSMINTHKLTASYLGYLYLTCYIYQQYHNHSVSDAMVHGKRQVNLGKLSGRLVLGKVRESYMIYFLVSKLAR